MSKKTVAVVGGTGAEGRGIALRLAQAGHRVIIGSRDAGRATESAAEASAKLPNATLEGMANGDAAAVAEIVFLTVPYAGQKPTVEQLRSQLSGKILVDVTVPLVPPAVSRVQLPDGGSAVEAVQKMLGDGVRVVSAFQNVSSHLLEDLHETVDCDVLVCGNDADARMLVASLIADCGLRPVEGGVLANSAAAEALTSVLIAINRRYKVKTAGVRFTGLPDTM